MLTQVGRRRTDHTPVGHQPSGDQRGIGGGRNPHGDIYAFIHDIYHPVGKQNVDTHVGKPRDEFGNQRHNLALTERNRRHDPQPAMRPVGRIADSAFRRINIRQDGLAALIEFTPHIRQTDPPRRPIEQAGTEPRFQPADLFGHRRRRNPKKPGCGGKIPGIYRRNKDGHLDTGRSTRHKLFLQFTDNMPIEPIIIVHSINYKCQTLDLTPPQTGARR
jgi:hypothetical protein